MTRRELEMKDYELRSFIAEKFKDIQMQAQSLKNVEDRDKALRAFAAIDEFIGDAKRTYVELEYLQDETPEDEENEDILTFNY